MTKIMCESESCTHNKEGICQRDSIWLNFFDFSADENELKCGDYTKKRKVVNNGGKNK